MAGYVAVLRVRAGWQKIAIAIIALVGIYWTTTKGMLAAFFLLTVCYLLSQRSRLPWGMVALSTVLPVFAWLLPMIVVLYEVGDPGRLNDAPFLLSSLWDRFSWMWPNALKLLDSPLHYILGRGLGTIGTPQSVGPTYYLLNAGDNIFIYAYVTFGLPALLYLLFPVWRGWFLKWSTVSCRDWYYGILILTFGYGVTTSMFEMVFFCCALGHCYGAAFSKGDLCVGRANDNEKGGT
jgi:hypothetical protein